MQPEIAELHFATYRRRPGLSERLQAELNPEDDFRRQGDELGEQGVAFWNAVLSLAMRRCALKEKFVEAALLHDFSLPERGFVLSRDQVMDQGIAGILPQLAPGEGLLLRSRLTLDSGHVAHLPMLDLACPCAGENAKTIRKMVKLAGVTEGILARSGHSYHFYGTRLLSAEGWARFMAFCLLFAPVTDSRYVAHRLLDGESRLKVIDSAGGYVPVIEEGFGDDA